MDIKRGDIYIVDLGEGLGSEHSGVKYALVVQNDVGNEKSTTTTIAPITKHYSRMITHVKIDGVLQLTSYIMCEHIRTISKCRLIKKVCTLPYYYEDDVSKAISIQLGLERKV